MLPIAALERGVQLDPWGHAHADVTIPLPCCGISEADVSGLLCDLELVPISILSLPKKH